MSLKNYKKFSFTARMLKGLLVEVRKKSEY